MAFPESEIRDALEAYLALRERIDRGELPWSALADCFTDDVVFIDPAWGRIEGKAALRAFLDESMAGLDDWSFPELWNSIDGNRVVTCFAQKMGTRPDGSSIECIGISTMYYAGDGRFCYEHDLMNMGEVDQLMREMKWRPPADFHFPPKQPNRDTSLPKGREHLAKP